MPTITCDEILLHSLGGRILLGNLHESSPRRKGGMGRERQQGGGRIKFLRNIKRWHGMQGSRETNNCSQ
jgi:hypothetical protein